MRSGLNETKFNIRDLNFRLIISATLLSVVGIFVVNSATVNETTSSLVSTTGKQILGVLFGMVIMIGISLIDYRKFVKYSWVFYLIAILSLVYVLLFTEAISGAKRWIHVRLLGTIQPSEFAKPALIIFMTFVLSKIGDRVNRFYMILAYFACGAPILLLVLKEPDLSTAIVIVVLLVTMLFLSGISYKWIIGVIIAAIPLVALFLVAVYQPGQTILQNVFEAHQLQRINAYFFPDEYPSLVYQQNNSVMAIGSGGLLGKGLRNTSLASVKNGNFLSEESCDFIFAVIGEELGFLGSAFVILLIAILTTECFRMAAKCKDISGKIIAGSAGTMLALQSFINIGVALLLIPNTGIPLPLVSAGLSSLLSTFILLGLVLSVGVYGKKKTRVFH